MKYARLVLTAALLATFHNPAAAKDAVKTAVANATGSPILQENGTPYAQGTYAVGTIQLTYTVVGYAFPAGPFGNFDVDWAVVANYASGGTTNYPIDLKLTQIGGTSVELTPVANTFNVVSNSDSGTSHVGISIASGVPSDPTLNCDGCSLVGNLRLTTSPSGAKLDTPTNILVKLVLAHPDACLKAYHFVTAQDDVVPLASTTLAVPSSGKFAGTVRGSNPSQYSDNVMIANTCPTDESFDLKIGLDTLFETNPSNNPGNAVFTYSTAGETDPGSFNLTAFGTGTGKGQQLCLQNVIVPADTTFLATVHSQVKKGTPASSLPTNPQEFYFGATLFDTVNSSCTGTLKPAVTVSNPAGVELPFAIQ